MKGTPNSLWLSWANRAGSIWTNAFLSAARRNQQALFTLATPRPASKPKRRRAKS